MWYNMCARTVATNRSQRHNTLVHGREKRASATIIILRIKVQNVPVYGSSGLDSRKSKVVHFLPHAKHESVRNVVYQSDKKVGEVCMGVPNPIAITIHGKEPGGRREENPCDHGSPRNAADYKEARN